VHGTYVKYFYLNPKIACSFNFAPLKGRAKNQVENRGGSNKEKVLLNIDTFKEPCIKSLSHFQTHGKF
jgi:hypothetical protein